jgi:AbrB family looped-hinge helix DNA binding protein
MKISERGQVTVPKKQRDRFGLKPDTDVEFVEVDHQLVLRKKRNGQLPIESVRGILRGQGGGKSTDQIIEELRGR